MSENNIEKFIKMDFMEFIDSEENQEDKIESLVKPSKEFYAVFDELIERLKKAITESITENFIHELGDKIIIILAEDKEKIRKELERIGVDSSTVYPDVQGYIDYIKENF